MTSKNIRRMTVTAILIALTIVFQLMRPVFGGSNPISTYIIGSLVNLCLIIAACVVGLWSGVAVAIVTPIIALMQGHAVLFMVPWIMAGNAALVVVFALFAQRDKGSMQVDWVRWILTGVIASLIKYVIIALGQTIMLTTKGKAFMAGLSVAAGAQHVQIVTALIGTIIAGVLMPMLPANVVGKE